MRFLRRKPPKLAYAATPRPLPSQQEMAQHAAMLYVKKNAWHASRIGLQSMFIPSDIYDNFEAAVKLRDQPLMHNEVLAQAGYQNIMGAGIWLVRSEGWGA